MNEYKFYLTLIVLFGSLLIIIFTGAFGYMTDILEGVGQGAKNIVVLYNSEHIENCVGCKEVKEGHLIVDTVISDAKDANVVFSTVTAMVTAYTSRVGETDDTPCISASGVNICLNGNFYKYETKSISTTTIEYIRIIACPKKYPFKTIVEINETKYICLDRMSLKHPDRFDIYMGQGEEAYNKAMNFGIQELTIKVYE